MLTHEALELILREASAAEAFEYVKVEGLAVPVMATKGVLAFESLEEFLPAPVAIKQTVTLASPDSFIDYVKEYRGMGTAIFAGKQSIVAVLDYHRGDKSAAVEGGAPAWCRHRAIYAPEHSHQWKAWLANNKKAMGQEAFAFFIEERLDDIIEPASATLLTAVLNFRETANMTLRSDKNLDTGEMSFEFVKENKVDKAKFPRDITVNIPIFEHHDHVSISAYVRYRAAEGVLSLWYQFAEDPIDIVRKQREKIAEDIKDALAPVPFYEGTA